MPELAQPEISIIVRPKSAIPYKNRPGFVVCDYLGDLVNLGMGDSQGLAMQGQNPTISDSWLQTGIEASQWKIPNGVQFIRFLKDGVFREGISAQSNDPNSDLFGVMLTGRYGYLDSKIADTTLEGDFTDLNWDEVQGQWQSVPPPDAQRYLRIRTVGSGATHKARTRGNIPANRSLAGTAKFSAQGNATSQAAARYQWGGDGDGALSLCWRHGQKITVERKEGGSWKILRALDMEPANMAGGRYVFSIRRIAGRLCISIGDRNFHFVFVDKPVSGRSKTIDAFWPAGNLQINTFNCHGTFGVSVIKYSDENDQVYSGEFGRIIRKNVPVYNDEMSNPPGLKFKGWARGGTSITGTAEVADFNVDYSVTMTASAAGIDTPFVSMVGIRFQPEWRSPSIDGVNLRPALQSGRITPPSLPSTSHAECQFTFDRNLLDSLIPNWQQYVNKYNPIEVTVRRKYVDNTYLDPAPVKLFKGYIYQEEYKSDGVNQHLITITGRDSLLRLTAPAAIVDHRYPPLDVFYMYGNPAAFYGSDAIREILRIALGDDEADRLNGNGNGLRFLNSQHYPLISFEDDSAGYIHVMSALNGQPPTTGGMQFPPKYGSDCASWMKDIGEYDKAVFFFGWPDGYNDDWPCLIYGRIPNLLQNQPLFIIPDKEYISGDKNNLLLQVSTEQRPDLDINRILVWANPAGQNAPDFIPALRMAEARLPASDINAPEKAWERTAVVRENIGAIPQVAEFIAETTIALLADNDKKWPSFTMRGNPYIQWGARIAFNFSGDESDQTIGLNYDEEEGKPVFRCQRVEHVFDLSGSPDVFTTNIQTRPMARGVL